MSATDLTHGVNSEMYGENHPHEWFKCLRGFLMEDRQVSELQAPGAMVDEVTLKELGLGDQEQMHYPRPYQLRQTEKFATGMALPHFMNSFFNSYYLKFKYNNYFASNIIHKRAILVYSVSS